MVRREIGVTEPLEEWVMDAFGDEADSRSEAYRMALAYGKRKWELEDKRAGSE